MVTAFGFGAIAEGQQERRHMPRLLPEHAIKKRDFEAVRRKTMAESSRTICPGLLPDSAETVSKPCADVGQ
jgi:hypothetical protein